MANAIRLLSADAVQKAKSGHPGLPMGMATAATVLWTRFLTFDPAAPEWEDRDRFILSAGHGSMLLYSLLHLTGYAAISIEDIKNFRQLGSTTPGHPEYEPAHGIETTTGPLAQGLGNAVGMALAERLRNARWGDAIVNHYTYCIVGDGCLMEGLSQEAISFAGFHKLARLIVLWDDNRISIDGPTSLATADNQLARFEACGWDAQVVDGDDAEAVARAIAKAKLSDKPSLIDCRTTIGKGAPKKAGTEHAHGAPLGDDEIAGARQALGWPYPPFVVPPHILSRMAGGRRARPPGARGLGAAFRRTAARQAGSLQAQQRRQARSGLAGAAERLQAQARHRSPEVGDAQGIGRSAGDPHRHLPGDHRRLGRSFGLGVHQDEEPAAAGSRRLYRPLRPLRRARACDGGDHERHGAAWRLHPLRRHLPGLRRLHARRHADVGADAPAGDLCAHPRFHRRRRGRPDAPSGGDAGEPPGDAEHAGVPSGGRGRDLRELADRGHRQRHAVGAGAHPPGGARPSGWSTRASTCARAAPTCCTRRTARSAR